MSVIAHILEAQAWEVVVPARPGAVNSESLNDPPSDWDRMPICLIELRFDDGLVALGEVGRGTALKELDPWLRQLPGLAVNGPSLGCLPPAWRAGFKWGLLESHPPALWQSPSPLIGAMEMALLDWAGKRLGCRAVDLLGGQVRDRVPVDYWCARQTPDDLIRVVARARELGFDGLKMKSKHGDPTLEQVQAIKQAGGRDFGITIDPMFQWLSPHDALVTLKQIEPFERVRIEDPFPQDRPEYWQRARQVAAVPLILHARGLDALRRGLQDRFTDEYNCTGGIQEFMTMAHALEVMGYSCWHGSAIEMGVAQVAHLHAAAAARACALHSDFVSPLVREHTLITWDWPFEGGALPLPEGDGLGVQLDRDAVARYAQAEAQYQ